ncbi:hypothetical protein ACFVUH_34835 [Kitasatospora sp. NPDC058032]|uniref:hypothetical protein n=1 Tax=Kitasatospora sp. NPDC058032 TaxID=3346307 RepID=UPI0036D8B24B
MPRHTYGNAMPPHLQAAAIRSTLEVVGYLQDVLQYSAPEMADHGWARMCMYRASDAMDEIGHFVGAIAAHMADNDSNGEMIRGLLRTDRECLRSARPIRIGGQRRGSRDLHRMPDWVAHEVRSSLAYVMVRLPVVLRRSVKLRNSLWLSGCLRPMVDSMDELGRLLQLLAGVHAEVFDEDTLARYQHLFQQRPRATMPAEDDRDYLSGLLGLREPERGPSWYFIGQLTAAWPDALLQADSYEVKVFTLLAMLDEEFWGQRRAGRSGRPMPRVQSAAMGCLNGLWIAMGEDKDDPEYWLTGHERAYAEGVASALTDRVASDFSGLPPRGLTMIEIAREAFRRAPVGGHR